MLVQPALIAHLLCRPVSIADSRWLREKLQVLRAIGGVCYVLGPPLSGIARPKRRGAYDPVLRSSSSTSSSSPRRLAARVRPNCASAPPANAVACDSSSARFSAASTATRSESTVRPLRGHGAHPRVHHLRQAANVLDIVPGEVIGLVVNLDGDIADPIARIALEP